MANGSQQQYWEQTREMIALLRNDFNRHETLDEDRHVAALEKIRQLELTHAAWQGRMATVAYVLGVAIPVLTTFLIWLAGALHIAPVFSSGSPMP